MHLDQLFPFIGHLPVARVHDGTIKPFIDQQRQRGLAPKSINNALGVVSTVLNRAARVWRDTDGHPWLAQAPAVISRLSVKGQQAKPYPPSWTEQDRLIKVLARHIADAALFAVNTGRREQEVCRLRWDWEVALPDNETSVLVLPASATKTSTQRVVPLFAWKQAARVALRDCEAFCLNRFEEYGLKTYVPSVVIALPARIARHEIAVPVKPARLISMLTVLKRIPAEIAFVNRFLRCHTLTSKMSLSVKRATCLTGRGGMLPAGRGMVKTPRDI